MGGGYAKIADPANSQGSYDDGSVDEDSTPRTENEEIAQQAAQSQSSSESGGGAASGNAKESKYATQRIKWADDEKGGPALAEPYYSDKLHYSVLYS
mmetsp:Transcript_17295/g.25350  ORF Transcript_17295/g.25350 Transcript_17295/m.25350 type:complete len:97 (+) Transcript_17295:209-499(+)